MTERYAHVIGLGLIGSSVALALQGAGWSVSGSDVSSSVTTEALERGVISSGEAHSEASLVIIATPAGVVPSVAQQVLADMTNPELIVTDVAGVKREIAAAITDERFLGGHQMAGSELRGFAGARADLFQGCTWILTPTDATSATVYSRLHGYLRELSVAVVAVSPMDHDRLVAIASHVPHVMAGALMNHAAVAAEQDAVLLQLAACGFRDMTRIAAGDPTIWPDILFQNRDAIALSLTEIEHRLSEIRSALTSGDRTSIVETLTSASSARRDLPGRAIDTSRLVRLRIPMPDRPGVLAAITMVASDLLVNIYDIEIAHGIEGTAGTLLLAVDREQADTLSEALRAKDFVVAREE